MNERHSRRTKRVRAGLATVVALIVLPVALYAWAAFDSPAPSDREFRTPASSEAPAADNGYVGLESLVDSIARASRQRIPVRYDAANRDAVHALLDRENVRRVPARLEQLLRTTRYRPTAPLESDARAKVSAGALDIVRLLRLQLQRELAAGERDAAWRTVELAARYTAWLRDRTHGFHELTLAQTGQNIWIEAVLEGIDADRWGPTELRAIVAWPQPALAAAAERLSTAIRDEYAFLEHAASMQRSRANPFLRAVSYQPNRTKREWLDAMRAPFAALQEGDVLRAHRGLREADAPSGGGSLRNGRGHRLVAGSLAGLATPFAQTLDALAELRLLQVRAALALYRQQHGQWPASASALTGAFGFAVPSDPWSESAEPLRYQPERRRVYSIGIDRRDDGGRFEQSLSRAPDYGVRLPD